MSVRAVLLCLVLLLAPTGTAWGGGVADEADLQFQLGARAYERSDFLGALEHFLASNRLVPNRNVMFNIARSYEQLGRFPDAYRYYIDAQRGETDAAIAADVESALTRIGARVAVVEIESVPSGATIYLDRKDLGSVGTTSARLGLAAGTYRFLVELPGHEPAVVGPFTLATGSRTPLQLTLTPIVGTLIVDGDPGTEVRLGDERAEVACATPCRLSVAPGPQPVYLSRVGWRGEQRTVNVVAREEVTVTAALAPQTGSLLLSTDEPNALVEIDGQRVGFAPTVVGGVAVGRRVVRVSLPGYEPITREVVIEPDQLLDLGELSLEPIREVSAASRESERIEDAPASVTVIDRQELAAFGYPTILEALRGVRGFAVNYDSIYGNAAVRGLGQANDYNNRLLVLSDGAVLNENILYQPFIHYDGRVDLGDIERIEIVRGPASVLYGTGAVSGVVNLVMRGRDAPEGAHVQASGYDDGTARVRGGVTYRLDPDTGAWLSFAAARSDGRDAELVFDDGSGTETAQTAHDVDRFHAWTATGKAWWKNTSAQVFYTWRRLTVPTGSFGAVFDDPRNYSDDRRFLTEVKHEADLGGQTRLQVRAYLNWAYYHQDAQFDATEEGQPIFIQNYQETYRSWWGGAEARLAFALGKRAKLTLGVDATTHTKVAMATGQYEQDGSWTPILDVDAPYQVLAGSALLDWTLSRRAHLQVGARFDYWNLDGNQHAAPGGENVVTSFPAVSPRVALIVKPNQRDVVKVMGGTAFRAPSAFEYYYADNGSTQVASSVCGETLDPENVYSLEVEASRRLRRDWVALAAAHVTYAREIIESVSVPMEERCGNAGGEIPPDVLYYRNSAVPQAVLGADLELRREWRSGIMLSAHYGLLVARYTSAPDPAIDDRALPNAPTHFASAKGVVPIVANLASGALRVTVEDERRVATSSTERTRRAVIADLVVSGLLGRYGVRYAVGLYNVFDWQLSLPAFPYASDLMPQAGRSVIVSLGYGL